jgi:Mce-associated membrane protein
VKQQTEDELDQVGDNAEDAELAEPDEEADEPAEPDAKRRKRFPLSLSAPVTIVLTLVLLAALAAGTTFGLLLMADNDAESAQNEALNTARSYAVTVTTYDFQHLDKNFADVLDGATGEFKEKYSGASSTLRQLLLEAKATASGAVLEAGVKSATPDRVEVLLFVNQTVTNAATADKPRFERNRILMTLEKHGDRWLVSKLELP